MRKGILLSIVTLALIFGGCGGKKTEQKSSTDSTYLVPKKHPELAKPTTIIMADSRANAPIKITTGANPATVSFYSIPLQPSSTAVIWSSNAPDFTDSNLVSTLHSSQSYTMPGGSTPVYYRVYMYFLSSPPPPVLFDTVKYFYLEPNYHSMYGGSYYKNSGSGNYGLVLAGDSLTLATHGSGAGQVNGK